MAADPGGWKAITPQHLLSAVEHIRKSFETSAWRCSEITGKLGFAALHPQTADLETLADYIAALLNYHRIVGPRAQRQFERLLSFRTPPAVFRAYCDLYQLGLEANIREQFDSTLKVALANSAALSEHPVDWAKLQLESLVSGSVHSVERWIKEVCDTQEVPEPESIPKEFEELVFWKKWRAPRLIHMQPAGNTPYDDATAWTRENEARTQQLLSGRSQRFVEFLDMVLEKLAGDAHVLVAQSRRDRVAQSRSEATADRSVEPSPEANSVVQAGGETGPQNQTRDTKKAQSDPEETRRMAIIKMVRNPEAHTVLSVNQAALYFGVKPRTIHRWKDEGHLRNGARRGSITIESMRRWQEQRSRRRRRG